MAPAAPARFSRGGHEGRALPRAGAGGRGRGQPTFGSPGEVTGDGQPPFGSPGGRGRAVPPFGSPGGRGRAAPRLGVTGGQGGWGSPHASSRQPPGGNSAYPASCCAAP